jgi:hypothetical protein
MGYRFKAIAMKAIRQKNIENCGFESSDFHQEYLVSEEEQIMLCAEQLSIIPVVPCNTVDTTDASVLWLFLCVH